MVQQSFHIFSDHQQWQQQDELGRGRAAPQGGLSGGGDWKKPARDGGLHRHHPIRLWKMGGDHPGRAQRKERRHGAGQALFHLRGESWHLCSTVPGDYNSPRPKNLFTV